MTAAAELRRQQQLHDLSIDWRNSSIDAEVLDLLVTVREGTPLAQMLALTLSLQIGILFRHFEADVDSVSWHLDRVIATRAQSGTAVPAPLVHTAQQAPAGRVDLSVRTGTRDQKAVRDARGLRRNGWTRVGASVCGRGVSGGRHQVCQLDRDESVREAGKNQRETRTFSPS